MSLDKKAIETLSVNAVRDSIVTSEFLDQFIADNDKEPSWDGFVYIYSDKSKKKSTLRGRMPVQVKGTECDDFSKSEISFQMSKDDLRNYLYNGGCMLFVVYIGNNGIWRKIYYVELTPIKLRQFLGDSSKSKAIHLKEFPSDSNSKATIFLNCFQNCKKQASFTEGKLYTLEELQSQGILEDVVIPLEGYGIDNLQQALLTNEVYIYAKIKGSSIPQPLDFIPKNIHTKRVISSDVTIGDKVYYSKYSVVQCAESMTFHFGESLTMKFTKPGEPCKVNYKHSDKIRVLAKDLNFMISYLEKGEFRVNNVVFPFDYSGADLTNFNLTIERERLEYVKRIVEVLDILRCDDELIISKMNGEDFRNLDRLIKAFVDKKPVQGLKHDIPPVCYMKVGNLRFALYFKKSEEAGTYELYDFFKSKLSVVYEKDSDVRLPISQFSILHTDDLLTISNIDYDVLLPSFQSVERHFDMINQANCFLLDSLAACDKATGNRKEKLLRVCDDFSKWVFSASDSELNYEIRLLNRLQTIKRQRDFNIDEISSLYELIENNETGVETRIAAYLLLDQPKPAELHFAKLSDEERKNFMAYPIYHFWKSTQESSENHFGNVSAGQKLTSCF